MDYKIVVPCFLGAKGDKVKLNERQASNLLAGGFIELIQSTKIKAK